MTNQACLAPAARTPAYRPEHDVAFPPYLSDREGNWFSVMKEAYDYTPDGKATFKRGVARDTLFYFNGFTKCVCRGPPFIRTLITCCVFSGISLQLILRHAGRGGHCGGHAVR